VGPLRQSWVEASDYWRKGSPYTPSGRDRGSMGRPGPRDSTVVHGGGLPRLRVLALIVGLGTRRHLFSDDTTLQHHTNVSNLQMRFDAPSPPPATVASAALFCASASASPSALLSTNTTSALTCRPTAPRRTFSAIYGHQQSYRALQRRLASEITCVSHTRPDMNRVLKP